MHQHGKILPRQWNRRGRDRFPDSLGTDSDRLETPHATQSKDGCDWYPVIRRVVSVTPCMSGISRALPFNTLREIQCMRCGNRSPGSFGPKYEIKRSHLVDCTRLPMVMCGTFHRNRLCLLADSLSTVPALVVNHRHRKLREEKQLGRDLQIIRRNIAISKDSPVGHRT